MRQKTCKLQYFRLTGWEHVGSFCSQYFFRISTSLSCCLCGFAVSLWFMEGMEWMEVTEWTFIAVNNWRIWRSKKKGTHITWVSYLASQKKMPEKMNGRWMFFRKKQHWTFSTPRHPGPPAEEKLFIWETQKLYLSKQRSPQEVFATMSREQQCHVSWTLFHIARPPFHISFFRRYPAPSP